MVLLTNNGDVWCFDRTKGYSSAKPIISFVKHISLLEDTFTVVTMDNCFYTFKEDILLQDVTSKSKVLKVKNTSDILKNIIEESTFD